ncbi:hypothetical protein [Tautonia sociabilis]|uniref:Glycosyltransferase RgtA/B/C/D-like domain-containing protein n=1 Tax=Tautonia sociabilis TaxID=2080755 RepID=A0A432MMA5_9BACT|nr:hypothetical protein [Tautonia sociabilis]RUL88542.1 hypothetical protein TsocGM_06365 [Tautonia sociabilis]
MRLVLRLLLLTCLAIALARAYAFLGYAAYQVVSPADAYHLEPKMAHLAWRVQHGRVLYPDWQSGPNHVTNFFSPLYFLAVGGIGRLLDAELEGLTRIGRVVTIASGLAAAALAGLASGRREGRFAGLFAGIVAIGAAPMIGFSTMVRPDTTADLLGFAGFLAAVGRGRPGRGRLALGGALLLAAIFAKQTAGLYAAAAVLALWLVGERRRSAILAGGIALASAALVAAVTMTVEPRFAADLLGEAGTPSSLENWRRILWRLWILGREMLLLTAVGVPLWVVRRRRDLPLLLPPAALMLCCSTAVLLNYREDPILMLTASLVPIVVLGLWAAIEPDRPREVPLATLAAVLLIGSAVAALKLGSELNYFMGLRLVAALAAGAIWGSVQRYCSSPEPGRSGAVRSVVMAVGLGVLGYGMIPSLVHALEQKGNVRSLVRFERGPGGVFVEARRQLQRVAADPGVWLLSDSGEIQLRQGDRAAFVDPWLFRVMVESGRIRPDAIRQRLEDRGYELVITTKDLWDAVEPYDSYTFGLPPELADAARRNYRLIGRHGGLFVYRPIETPAPPLERQGG